MFSHSDADDLVEIERRCTQGTPPLIEDLGLIGLPVTKVTLVEGPTPHVFFRVRLGAMAFTPAPDPETDPIDQAVARLDEQIVDHEYEHIRKDRRDV